ncbi:MAG: anthranilate phosphoribosyltransferase [Promethearchaeota archaeon]
MEKKALEIKKAIHKKIVSKADLTSMEAYLVMKEILDGLASPAQIGAFLVALRSRAAVTEEVTGFVRCMKEHAVQLNVNIEQAMIDTCGTGGDKIKTINISTLAAIIVAACGEPVAKHGNRAVTSRCGSADVLEMVGVDILIDPQRIKDIIEKIGIGFLFAPKFHPAMRNAIRPRKEIGLRTVFNILGPLTNPSNISGQVIGIYDVNVAKLIADVLTNIGMKRFFIIHNANGADELLPVGKNHVIEGHLGKINRTELRAKDFGLKEGLLKDIIAPSGPDVARDLFIKILKNEMPGIIMDAVLMNCSLALKCGGLIDDYKDGVEVARQAIEEGKALQKLEELVKETDGNIRRFESLIK